MTIRYEVRGGRALSLTLYYKSYFNCPAARERFERIIAGDPVRIVRAGDKEVLTWAELRRDGATLERWDRPAVLPILEDDEDTSCNSI